MQNSWNVWAKVLIRYWWAAVLMAVVIAFAAIVLLAQGQSLWFDEGYSILLAQQSYGDILRLTGVDAHPPLYYFFLKAWGDTFGWSELALRSLSAVFAVGGIGAAAVLVRHLFNRQTALVALPVLALSPFWLRYGYEVRMYSLAGLIIILASLVLFFAIKHPRKFGLWAIYGVLVALGMYTLYMTLAAWVAHLGYLVYKRRHGLLKQPWVGAYILSVLIFVPYLPTFIHQMLHSALPGVGSDINLTQIGNIIGMSTVFQPEWMMNKWQALVALAYVGVAIAAWVKVRPLLGERMRTSLYFALTLAAGPLVFFVAYGLITSSPYFVVRYIAHVAPLIYLFVGSLLALAVLNAGQLQRYITVSVVVAALAVGLVQLNANGNFVLERNQRPSTAELVKDVDCANTTVVTDGPYEYIDSVFYLKDCDVRFYSEDKVDFAGGYAYLADRDNLRVSGSSVLDAQNVAVVYYPHDGFSRYKPGEKYHYVETKKVGSQMMDSYRLSVE